MFICSVPDTYCISYAHSEIAFVYSATIRHREHLHKGSSSIPGASIDLVVVVIILAVFVRVFNRLLPGVCVQTPSIIFESF